MPAFVEAYDIVTRLGRAEGIAAIGKILGPILAASDKPDDARAVLRRSAEIYRKLGRDEDVRQAEDLIRELG